MDNKDKAIQRYVEGLVVLFQVINSEQDLDKASNLIHDLLLGYEVVGEHEEEFKKGLQNVQELFINFPRENDASFNRNDILLNYLKFD